MPINMDKIQEYCRLCQLNPGTVYITDNENFMNQVFECTRVKINDEHMHLFPKTVCPSCKLGIEDFFLFIEQVRLVNQKLHSQFLKHDELKVNLPTHDKNIIDIHETEVLNKIPKTCDARLKCPVCPKTYARFRNLQLHKRGHINLFCATCELTFDDTISRKSHKCRSFIENSTNRSENESDNKSFQNRINFVDVEMDKVENQVFQEQETKRGIKKEWFEDEFPEDNEERTSKIMNGHTSEDDTKISVNSNQSIERDVNQKKKPRDVHSGTSFPCTYENCNKICTSAYTLRTHLMRHEGKMPFLCVTCGKGFTTKNSLNCHEKIHAKVKAYVCKECNIGFSVASNLRAHQKKHHEGVRFYCSQCTRAFITKCSLERHELVHTGIKEFKCESCRAEFYTNKELLKHQRYHLGLRLYKCEQCFKTFFEKHHLTIHIRVHTGERPYVCKVMGCGKSFAESQKLSRHIKAIHPPM